MRFCLGKSLPYVPVRGALCIAVSTIVDRAFCILKTVFRGECAVPVCGILPLSTGYRISR